MGRKACKGLLVAVALMAAPAWAADTWTLSVTIKDHKFDPDTIAAPADKKLVLEVTNLDQTVEEFDSHDLQAEKIVPPGQTVSVRIAALHPGTYHFMGEYHAATAQGTLTVTADPEAK